MAFKLLKNYFGRTVKVQDPQEAKRNHDNFAHQISQIKDDRERKASFEKFANLSVKAQTEDFKLKLSKMEAEISEIESEIRLFQFLPEKDKDLHDISRELELCEINAQKYQRINDLIDELSFLAKEHRDAAKLLEIYEAYKLKKDLFQNRIWDLHKRKNALLELSMIHANINELNVVLFNFKTYISRNELKESQNIFFKLKDYERHFSQLMFDYHELNKAPHKLISLKEEIDLLVTEVKGYCSNLGLKNLMKQPKGVDRVREIAKVKLPVVPAQMSVAPQKYKQLLISNKIDSLSESNYWINQIKRSFKFWFNPNRFITSIFSYAELILEREKRLSENNNQGQKILEKCSTALLHIFRQMSSKNLKKLYENIKGRQFANLYGSVDFYKNDPDQFCVDHKMPGSYSPHVSARLNTVQTLFDYIKNNLEKVLEERNIFLSFEFPVLSDKTKMLDKNKNALAKFITSELALLQKQSGKPKVIEAWGPK